MALREGLLSVRVRGEALVGQRCPVRGKLVGRTDRVEIVRCLNPLSPPTSGLECVELNCDIGLRF